MKRARLLNSFILDAATPSEESALPSCSGPLLPYFAETPRPTEKCGSVQPMGSSGFRSSGVRRNDSRCELEVVAVEGDLAADAPGAKLRGGQSCAEAQNEDASCATFATEVTGVSSSGSIRRFCLKNTSASRPACLEMARNVPSGMSPGWFGMVVWRFSAGLNQISWERADLRHQALYLVAGSEIEPFGQLFDVQLNHVLHDESSLYGLCAVFVQFVADLEMRDLSKQHHSPWMLIRGKARPGARADP